MSEEKAKLYIDEIFSGNGMIAAFCKVHTCDDCYSTTRLYNRVLEYHNSSLVQNEYLKATERAKECFLDRQKN